MTASTAMTREQPGWLTAPGSAAGPTDPRARGASRHCVSDLRHEHASLSCVLSVLSGEVERLPDHPRLVLPLLADAFEFVSTHVNHAHHAREEAMFARLAHRSRRKSQPSARLRREHDGQLRRTRRIRARIAEAMLAPTRDRLVTLAEEIASFVNEVREHLSREERIMHSAAVRALDTDDWTAIDRVAPPSAAQQQFGPRGGRYPLLARYLRSTGQRTIAGDGTGVLEHLGFDKLGYFYGEAVGYGVGTFMLAQSQGREAVTLALTSAQTLLTPRSPAAYTAIAREIVRNGLQAMSRWSDHWQMHFGLVRDTEDARRAAQPVATTGSRRPTPSLDALSRR